MYTYFMVFGIVLAIVNDTVLKISISNCLLQLYRNKINFCMQTVHSAVLPNSPVSSSGYFLKIS